MLLLKGTVRSGRGAAASHIEASRSDIEKIIDGPVYPESLNVILDAPVRLNLAEAAFFENGRRMLWPATMNGSTVWLYRWAHAALHVVEIVAPFHIRRKFGLEDGDRVTIEVRKSQVARIDLLSRAVWALVWVGRRHWPYTNDRYYLRLQKHCRALGATQEERTEGLNYVISRAIRAGARRVPIVRRVAKRLLGRNAAAAKPKRNYVFARQADVAGETESERRFRALRNLLAFTKSSNSDYSAEEFPAGYHTIEFEGQSLAGQRKPGARLDLVPIDFTGKSVLDIGSNQGGMIFHVGDRIRWGVGIDYDHRMVNVANWIARSKGRNDLRFFAFNLEQEPLDLIQDFLPEPKADVCFLLSVCMWIGNWREVIDVAAALSRSMVFESNGTDEQQDDQIAYLRSKYRDVRELSGASLDDPRQSRRKLYFLTDPVTAS